MNHSPLFKMIAFMLSRERGKKGSTEMEKNKGQRRNL